MPEYQVQEYSNDGYDSGGKSEEWVWIIYRSTF